MFGIGIQEIVILILALPVYFLPTIIAFYRGHPKKLPIIIINVLFGGTVIGWVIAFIWAMKKIPVAGAHSH
ncbi:MAG: superinfection immunity protein [Candidatus Eisenbacteria bacterium]|uniref:Superinfection immunity protein n=1 Tax=Eiseniibacteriota bacterium TaxID=2212470 RepID=A0A7Y2H165_UNCEI|nr:superinfection immunity protein [Candidatus Eisenbacteria bacterium]